MPPEIPTSAIAPCGMNCTLCYAFQRDKNPCPGCFSDEGKKPPTRQRCKIKTCEMHERKSQKRCLVCGSLPCKLLSNIDKRYREKYGMSMIGNLRAINEIGLREFVKAEGQKWACPVCGSLICVHKHKCLRCGTPLR